ncbi:hypothetical protein ACIHFE_18360 [Streptomyces sp. NPDC052396]|uniref:hypothetical protein n=1 Tax=Streptomyces sp. NPDC052396 TaxID=3365689 RepID=UPI0037D05FE8
MAHDHEHGWLDEGSAERLLAGDPLAPCPVCGDSAHGQGRCTAGELEAALNALRPPAVLPDGPLPGEEAALAAFRTARAERSARSEVPELSDQLGHSEHLARSERSDRSGRDKHPVSDEPPIPGEHPRPAGRAAEVAVLPARRPRLRRPARVAMVVAVAGCALSGVAVAAGLVDLPAALGGSGHKPSAGVAVEDPDQASGSPVPQASGAVPGDTPYGTARPSDRPSPGHGRPGTGSSATPGDRPAGPSAGPSASPRREDGRDTPAPEPRPTGVQRDWLVRICRDYLGANSLLGKDDQAVRTL